MALTEKNRTIIYAHFVETIGEEAAEAMLSQFPARDLDEPVTKEFVQTEIADVRREVAVLRGEMHSEFARVRTEIADLRGDMTTEFAKVRGEMTTGFADLRGEMKDLGNTLAVRLQVTVGVVVGVVGGLLALQTYFTR